MSVPPFPLLFLLLLLRIDHMLRLKKGQPFIIKGGGHTLGPVMQELFTAMIAAASFLSALVAKADVQDLVGKKRGGGGGECKIWRGGVI